MTNPSEAQPAHAEHGEERRRRRPNNIADEAWVHERGQLLASAKRGVGEAAAEAEADVGFAVALDEGRGVEVALYRGGRPTGGEPHLGKRSRGINFAMVWDVWPIEAGNDYAEDDADTMSSAKP